ncbi:MAG: cation/H(+) antiporter [Porphyromonadaceae bacterium CG2_30_38_12]|nr:MAG: cation/H(+) antiporter [Porphyromonadaceae bacterium CG2_30_38_12]
MQQNKKTTWLFYGSIMAVVGVLTYLLFQYAEKFDSSTMRQIVPARTTTDHFELFINSLYHNLAEPSAMLLLQILAILFVSRVAGYLFIRIGQPTVIGEILAGILLGPSLLGFFFPDAYHFLFNASSLSNIYIISQIGLVLFMFAIGMELDLGMLRNKMGVTFVISNASIIIPYFMGMVLAYFLYQEFAASQTDFLSFALFIGISMSITAFPVLARIVQEKGLAKSHLGTIALASAAFNDVIAWCVLAAVIAITKTGSIESSLYNILFSVVYVLLMFFVIKPFLKRISDIYKNSEVVNKSVFAFFLLMLIASAYTTQLIGIHALFGAFLAGVIMPSIPSFRKLIVDRIEDLSLTLLLPLFFVYTGLRTEIGLLNTPYLWSICLLIIVVAVAGKFIGSAFSARFLGETWKDSLSIGILMNTRGLMELIVLNIGYEMGILPPAIFVMLVIMALVTTFMTTPMLSVIERLFPEKYREEAYTKQQAMGVFKALVSLGNPENGKTLLRIAKTVLEGSRNSLQVNVLHITPGTNINPLYSEEYASESFKQVVDEANHLNIPITTEYKINDNIENCIVRTTNIDNYDFLLVGAGVSLSGIPFFKERTIFSKSVWMNKIMRNLSKSQQIFYPGSLIKDKTRYFIENSRCSVGVFVNRGFTKISTTIVILHNEQDDFLIRYARRLVRNDKDVSVFVMDINNVLSKNSAMREALDTLQKNYPKAIKIIKSSRNNATIISRFSFLLISYQAWNELSVSPNNELSAIPSTLIIHKKDSRFHKLQHELIFDDENMTF